MNAQIPAEGILKRNDWGDAKTYDIVCGCGQSDHTHNLWVESSEVGVEVNIYVETKSPFWSMNRFEQIWTLLTKGYLQHETTIHMSEQQALNYAETLKKAVQDVKGFKKTRKSL